MKAKTATWRGYPETFHIDFFIADRDELERLSERLRTDDFDAGQAEDSGYFYECNVMAPVGSS